MVHRGAARMNSAPGGCGERRRAWEDELKEFDHPCGIADRRPLAGVGRQPLPTYPVCCVPSVRRNAGYVNQFEALLSPDRLEASA